MVSFFLFRNKKKSIMIGVVARTINMNNTQLLFRREAHLFSRFMKSKPKVAVINLLGPIQAGNNKGQFGNSKLNLAFIEKSIDKAFSLKNLNAVLLNINSPGGSPVQSELIAQRIIRLSKRKNIKVYSFVEDVGASGGYLLACAGDEIFASKNSIVGSIGVISYRMGFHELLKKHGLDWRVHTAGKSKSFLDPFQAEKEEDVEKLKHALNIIHRNFIDYVKSRRGGRLNYTDDVLFNGDIWVGQDAVDAGLIDGIDDIGNFIETHFGEKGKDVKVMQVNVRKGFREMFGAVTSTTLSDIVGNLHGERFKIM